MSRLSVKPELVKTLRDWSARWPKAQNLGFDPETREPTVYSQGAERTKVSSIPWKREGDTMTILAQPTRFSPAAVDAATKRYGRIREQRAQMSTAGAEQLRVAEAALLDAWRTYNAAPPATRGPLRRDILTAERAVVEMEEALAAQLYKGRCPMLRDEYRGTYVPPMPENRRGIPLTAVAGGAAAGTSEE
jgi:hypothetical protein